jgi:hypothetical protein
MTEKQELWKLVREWLSKQKNISKRVRLEALEYGPPYAELCTIGNRYTWACIYDNYIEFYTETDGMMLSHPVTRLEVVLKLYAHDKEFFKKMKHQLWSMLYAGNLNWPNNV